MKNNVLTGVLLIFLGTFWFLSKIGIITWSIWSVLYNLWPLILVAIGTNIIFKDKYWVRIIVWIVFIALVIGFGFYQQYNDNIFFNNNEHIIYKGEENFKVENQSKTEEGQLKLMLGGANFKLDSTKDNIINAFIPNPRVRKEADFNDDKSKINIEIKQLDDFNNNEPYDYKFSLHEDIVWDIDVDMGAFNGVFDFSNLKVNELDLDMGASNVDLIFGERHSFTKVNIDGGVSNIDLTLPESLGVRIKSDGLLKDTNIDELGWILKNGYYMSPNYDISEKKIDIDIDMGIGKFKVKVQ